ncbi:MAG: hypothetical protein U0175_35035 [Caldilineaceae bacterium]
MPVESGSAPILLRVDPGSGHGIPSTDPEAVEHISDRLSFLALHLGLPL